MKAGYAKTDITPGEIMELSGYGWYLGRKFEGVDDRLYARALGFDDDKIKMLLINCDLIGIKREISDYVRETLAGEFNMDKSRVMVICTHTHTGPATGTLVGLGEEKEKYLEELTYKLVETGRKALNSMEEIRALGSISKEIEPISFNRVFKDGPVDKTVRGFSITFKDEKTLDVLSYACHPVTRGVSKNISADFPGKVCEALEDTGRDAIFITGVCGDINPRTHQGFGGKGDGTTIGEYGMRIASVVREKMEPLEPLIDGASFFPTINLRQYSADDIDNLVAGFSGDEKTTPGMMRVIGMWGERMKEKISGDPRIFEEEMEIQVMKLGSVLIVGFPGEVFTGLAEIVRGKLSHLNVIVAGNVNSTMRYIPTEEDIINDGYAGLTSNFFYMRFPMVAGQGEKLAAMVGEFCSDRF